MAKKIDATTGNLIKKIFAYTIPLILSTMLQNSFTIADQAVLGNMAGSVAVASIGATSVVTSLIINGAVGLSMGVSIILARYVGQKDEEKMRKTIDTALITAVLFGVVIAVVGVLLAPMFLKATNCPDECFDDAVLYAISNVLAHSLQAFGYPFFTSISNIAFTLGFRVVWMQFVYPLCPQFSTIMLCFLVSWTLNGILYAIFFAVVYRRYMKKSICKKI